MRGPNLQGSANHHWREKSPSPSTNDKIGTQLLQGRGPLLSQRAYQEIEFVLERTFSPTELDFKGSFVRDPITHALRRGRRLWTVADIHRACSSRRPGACVSNGLGGSKPW